MATQSTRLERKMPAGLRAGRGKVTLIAERAEAAAGGIDGWLLTAIAGLCAFGLVMVYSASEALGYIEFRNANYFFERQGTALVLGLAGLIVAARMDYHRWRRLTKPLVIATVVLLVLVLIPHVGVNRNGARRWFSLGPLSLQPSAVAAIVAIIGFSRWLSDRGPRVRTWKGVRDYAILVAGLLFLIVLEKDLGTAIVAGCVAFTLLALGGGRKRHLVLLAVIASAGGWMLVTYESFRAARLANWLDPFADPLNGGYQPVQSLLAMGSGGITGVGLGNSIQKYNWLPEAHSDFIFAIIGEELGLIGTVSVILAFLFLGWRGIRTSLRAPDSYGSLLAGGITAWICIQAFINIGAVTNVIPTTGIPLPFISYGGTSLAMTLLGMGILCNISAQGRRQGDQRRAHFDRWRGDGGTSNSRSGRRPGIAARRG